VHLGIHPFTVHHEQYGQTGLANIALSPRHLGPVSHLRAVVWINGALGGAGAASTAPFDVKSTPAVADLLTPLRASSGERSIDSASSIGPAVAPGGASTGTLPAFVQGAVTLPLQGKMIITPKKSTDTPLSSGSTWTKLSLPLRPSQPSPAELLLSIAGQHRTPSERRWPIGLQHSHVAPMVGSLAVSATEESGAPASSQGMASLWRVSP
jgi:hypothetical protein